MQYLYKVKHREILTVSPPDWMLHVVDPEGRIPPHCRSPGRICVWYTSCCSPENKDPSFSVSGFMISVITYKCSNL